MSCYWFNKKKTLQKAKERYSKEKAAEYHLEDRKAIKKGKELIKKLVKRRKRQD